MAARPITLSETPKTITPPSALAKQAVYSTASRMHVFGSDHGLNSSHWVSRSSAILDFSRFSAHKMSSRVWSTHPPGLRHNSDGERAARGRYVWVVLYRPAATRTSRKWPLQPRTRPSSWPSSRRCLVGWIMLYARIPSDTRHNVTEDVVNKLLAEFRELVPLLVVECRFHDPGARARSCMGARASKKAAVFSGLAVLTNHAAGA